MKLREVTEMRNFVRIFVLSLLTASGPAMAQPADVAGENAGTPIETLIEQLAEDMDREFVIDPRIRGIRSFATTDDIDYDTLLGILRISDVVAIETGDQIHVMPDANMRWQPTRILQEDDPGVSDHEVVTRIIKVPEVGQVTRAQQGEAFTEPALQATQLVPILRPMMGQAAQLGAVPNTNALVVVDRYDNIRRITAVIEEIAAAIED
jgi:general secretion pathway protein D